MRTKLPLLLIMLALMAGVHTTLAQTTLGIASASGKSVLRWPAALTNYVLQSNTNLFSTNWVTVSNPAPVTVSNEFTLTITNTPAARFFRLYSTSTAPLPAGMVAIPAGTFTMGDSLDGETDAMPTVAVDVTLFHMDTNLVTYAAWQTVYNWATNHGYMFDNAGSGKTNNNPVQTVDWYDAVKWCNARSELEGLTPAYYTNAAQTLVYRIGKMNLTNTWVNWTAGYRLPTEAEWEKAARGGLSGQRFPWGNTISESQANYYGDTNLYSYDMGPNGYNAAYATGALPDTSPVGSFAPNGYGLYDMAGNIAEWCWDYYGTPYAGGTDPLGPTTGTNRVVRGGVWVDYASYSRCACRSYYSTPGNAFTVIGFRCVRGN